MLGRVDERAGGASAGAESLDRLHHVGGLLEKRLADLLGPRKILIHPFQNLGVVDEGLHALVPRTMFNLGAVVGKIAQVTCREYDIGRGGRGGQDQCDQCIGIERDGGEELLELFCGAQRAGGSCGFGRSRCARNGDLCNRRGTNERQEAERTANGFHGGERRSGEAGCVGNDRCDEHENANIHVRRNRAVEIYGATGRLRASRWGQICEYAVGTRKRAVFFDVLFAHFGSSFNFCQRGSGPNFFQFARCAARSGPEVM